MAPIPTHKYEGPSARTSVSIPMDLKQAMYEVKHLNINWSAVAASAFRSVLLRVENGEQAGSARD